MFSSAFLEDVFWQLNIFNLHFLSSAGLHCFIFFTFYIFYLYYSDRYSFWVFQLQIPRLVTAYIKLVYCRGGKWIEIELWIHWHFIQFTETNTWILYEFDIQNGLAMNQCIFLNIHYELTQQFRLFLVSVRVWIR